MMPTGWPWACLLALFLFECAQPLGVEAATRLRSVSFRRFRKTRRTSSFQIGAAGGRKRVTREATGTSVLDGFQPEKPG